MMDTLEALFQRHSGSLAKLVPALRALLSRPGSPAAVKCTKRLYNSVVKNTASVFADETFDHISILLHSLRYIANSHSPSTGFGKFITFGLPDKIVEWCDGLCTLRREGDSGWERAVDDLLFTVSVITDHSEDAKQSMVVLIPSLLRCISNAALPCVARIEAARVSNQLLEVCDVEHKQTLTTRPDIRRIIEHLGAMILSAGDFELQVAIVEGIFRITTGEERGRLAGSWFHSGRAAEMFTNIRESEFETDCRQFLNMLNEGAGKKRSVYSLPCKKAMLGAFQLQRPLDEGLQQFWIDFNTISRSMSLFVEDPGAGSEGMWETVVVKGSAVTQWGMQVQRSECVLSVVLADPAHTLLPPCPPSTSHTVTIVFSSQHNPTIPSESVFGRHTAQKPTSSPTPSMKSSTVITPIFISRSKSSGQRRLPSITNGSQLQQISPIEPPPYTPAVGGNLSSQDSATPPNQAIPLKCPATSTPKPRATPSSRLPLQFVGNGVTRTLKTSQAMTSVQIAGNRSSRVVREVKDSSTSWGPSSRLDRTKVSLQGSVGGGPKQGSAGGGPKQGSVGGGPKQGSVGGGPKQGSAGGGGPKQGSAGGGPPKQGSAGGGPKQGSAGGGPKQGSAGGGPTKEGSSRGGPTKQGSAGGGPTKQGSLRGGPTKQGSSRGGPTKQGSAGGGPTKQGSAGGGPKLVQNNVRQSRALSKTSTRQGHQQPVSDSLLGDRPASLTSNKPAQSSPDDKPVSSPDDKPVSSPDEKPISSPDEKPISSPDEKSVSSPDEKSVSSPADKPSSAVPSESSSEDSRRQSVKSVTACKQVPPTPESSSSLSFPQPPLKALNAYKRIPPTPESSSPPSPCWQPLKGPNTSRTFLRDVTNDLNASRGRKRVFNLSDAPGNCAGMGRGRGRGKKGKPPQGKPPQGKPPQAKPSQVVGKARKPPLVKTSAFTFTDSPANLKLPPPPPPPTLDTSTSSDPDAIPDSLPLHSEGRITRQKQQRAAIPPSDSDTPSPPTKRVAASKTWADQGKPGGRQNSKQLSSRRVAPPRGTDSFSFDSDPESDISWEIKPAGQTRRGAKTLLTSTRAKKTLQLPPSSEGRNTRQKHQQFIAPSDIETPSPPTKVLQRVPATKAQAEQEKSDGNRNSKPPAYRQTNKPAPARQLRTPSTGNNENSSTPVNTPLTFRPPKRPASRRVPEQPPPPSKKQRMSSGYSSMADSPNSLPHAEGAEEEGTTPAALPPSCTPAPLPPSPSSSLYSSQVGPDANITAGFEQICKNLIAQAGGKASNQRQTHIEISDAEPSPPLTLTQLSRQIVSSSKAKQLEPSKPAPRGKTRKTKTPQAGKRKPLVITTPKPVLSPKAVQLDTSRLDLDLSLLSGPEDTPAPLRTTENRKRKISSEHDSNPASPDSSSAPLCTISDHDDPLNISAEMRSMLSSFSAGMNKATRNKRSRLEEFAKSASNTTFGKLAGLWGNQQRERSKVLSVFRQQLCRELETLETEVMRTHKSEEKAISLLQEQMKIHVSSCKTQQKQIGRLSVLQQSLHEQLGSLEEQQSRERVTNQRSLKKEMQQMQTRLLQESQKREMARIKQSLHTMLMKL